jgi:uncharacterized protein (TIGR00661 family)
MGNKPLKFVFIVQGEGRGHMTQAIALKQQLDKRGHVLAACLVGSSKRREIPEFFYHKMGVDVIKFESPNFICDPKNKSVKIGKTIGVNLLKSNRFLKSLKLIDRVLELSNADVIVNFYDLLGGIYNLLLRPKAKFIVIGHQYLASHPDFPFVPKRQLEKFLFKLNNAITALNSDLKLALSFSPYPALEKPGFKVVPPLLRSEIQHLKVIDGDFILAYMVNSGYAEELIAWHRTRPDIKIHCFWDNKQFPQQWAESENLIFHQVNDKHFLEMMAACKGFITTAGFESICEAIYLKKPVMMVPIKGQFEQGCNALDAQAAGAGIWAHDYNPDPLLHYIPKYRPTNYQWLREGPSQICSLIEESMQIEAVPSRSVFDTLSGQMQ